VSEARPQPLEQPTAVDAALEAAGIAAGRRGSERLRRLDDGERALYRWVLRTFAAGAAPEPAGLREAAATFGVRLDKALVVLAAEDLVHLDPATRVVAVAYPFSSTPRGHRVLIDGKQAVEAMCAIDALGIAPMLELPIEVFSHDPISGREVWVRIDLGDGAWWEPEEAVVLAGSSARGGPSFRSCCSILNFFESGESALQYLLAHPEVTGHAVTLPEAIEAGRLLFGDLLEEV
jgi:Alkylmercury lyase